MEKTNDQPQEVKKSFGIFKILWPLIFGLIVIAVLFYYDYEPDAFSNINFTNASIGFILVAILLMCLRHFGYMIRLRILTNKDISWNQSFKIILLWEFSSAITPSAIGGTGLAIIFINKEGLSVGRSTAIAMATSFLDEIYFSIFFPILFFVLGKDVLFFSEGENNMSNTFSLSLLTFAIIGYCIKLSYVGLMSYALFYNPRGFKWLLIKVFKLKFLKKWRHSITEVGDDIIVSSRELKNKNFTFWLKAFVATFLSWTARYWVLNVILVAFWFTHFNLGDHLVIFARQFVHWITMMVSPTPGGSGFAEVVFKKYFEEFLPFLGVTTALAFLWRIISYYSYLIGGAIYVPRWLNKHFKKRNKSHN